MKLLFQHEPAVFQQSFLITLAIMCFAKPWGIFWSIYALTDIMLGYRFSKVKIFMKSPIS